MQKVHYDVCVKGKVQGVWFRKYTKDKADLLGLKGIVKNNKFGDVSIKVEGEKEVVKIFLDWLNEGSPLSKVKEVQLELGKVQGYDDFKIISQKTTT